MFLCHKLRHALILLILFVPITLSYAVQHQTINLKILGINDFHGQISTGKTVGESPVGGAAVLAAYMKQAQSGMEERTLITIMGDLVGASPPSSALLHDEPSILFINSLGNKHCSADLRMNPLCNVVATVGNHEFDKGQKSMFDLMYGTAKEPTDGWIPLPYYPGATYPYISANIVDALTESPLFPPYTIKSVQGIQVAFIGAVLKNAADSILPLHVEGIKFLDEAEAINKYVQEVKSLGAQIIVVLIHEGGNQTPYDGETQLNTQVEGRITEIVNQLDDDIDVVMGGHTHEFLNAFIPNRNGVSILVTQANSSGASFAEVTLQVDALSHKVKKKSAQIIITYTDREPGNNPDKPTQKLVQFAEEKVATIITTPVGIAKTPLLRKQNDDGESNLGNLIADAFRTVMKTDIGITNPNGMRDDINSGVVRWGAIYSALPFTDSVVSISLTGNDIYELLEQQWMGAYANILQISGLNYTYDVRKPLGHKITTIEHSGVPLNRERVYTIATSNFLASGNGRYSVLKRGRLLNIGGNDHEMVIHYIKQLPQPFVVQIEGRIKKEHS